MQVASAMSPPPASSTSPSLMTPLTPTVIDLESGGSGTITPVSREPTNITNTNFNVAAVQVHREEDE